MVKGKRVRKCNGAAEKEVLEGGGGFPSLSGMHVREVENGTWWVSNKQTSRRKREESLTAAGR